MKKPPELYVIQEPAPAERKVLHLVGGMRAAGPAPELRPLGRPWPRQQPWRDLVRQLKPKDPKD